MCNCNKTTNTVQYVPVPVNNTNINCEYTLEYLLSLKNTIDSFIVSNSVSVEDFNLLQIYKGKILSGINLVNYCYANYSDISLIINNVISKY